MTLSAIIFWSLVVWRFTALLVYDTITAGLRDRIGVAYDEYSECQGSNFVASALCCHRCTSVWVAALATAVFLRPLPIDFVPNVLALSAGSIIVNKIVGD